MRCTESARRVIAASDISGQLAFDTEAWRPAAPPCARGMETNFVVPACKQWALVQQLCRHNAPTLLLNPQPSPLGFKAIVSPANSYTVGSPTSAHLLQGKPAKLGTRLHDQVSTP